MTDELLQVLSTRGTMSLAEFERAMDILHADAYPAGDDVRFVRRRVVGRLDALGHCDVDFTARKVACYGPATALLPGNWPARAALCGARSPGLLARLDDYAARNRDEVAVTRISQHYAGVPLPEVVVLESPRAGGIAACVAEVGIATPGDMPSAWEIACVAGSLDDYIQEIQSREFHPLNWPCRTFDPTDLQFKRGDQPDLLPRLVEYTSPVDQQRQHFWITGREALTMDRNWGRFLALRIAGRRVLLYDEQQQLLAVPASTDLPRLLARAATLCSARAAVAEDLPIEVGGVQRSRKVEVFTGVPKFIAEMIASKVGQSDYLRSKFQASFAEVPNA